MRLAETVGSASINKIMTRIRSPHKKGMYSATDARGFMIPCQVEAYFLALNEYVEENSRVLDVGFGLGYGLNILSIKAREVVGIDVDPRALDYCMGAIMHRNPKLSRLMLYDGYNVDFPNRAFEVVTCVDVIEHVEDYDRLITEMLRVSRKGVFISTPNRRPEYTNPDGTPKNHWHLREWSHEEFDELVTKHGKVKWQFINGPFEGPFSISDNIEESTMALAPFIHSPNL